MEVVKRNSIEKHFFFQIQGGISNFFILFMHNVDLKYGLSIRHHWLKVHIY